MIEAGCDEAGRGCLAGSVYAAAVILPPDYQNPDLNDSKKLTDKKRKALREQIERDAVAWAVGIVTPLTCLYFCTEYNSPKSIDNSPVPRRL